MINKSGNRFRGKIMLKPLNLEDRFQAEPFALKCIALEDPLR
jgi:hypothetical protein